MTTENTESPEQSEAAAQAAFDRVRNNAPAEPEAKPVEKPVEKPEQVPDAAAQAAEDEWAGVSPVVRKTLESISGKVGSLDRIEHRLKGVEGRTGAALEGVHSLKVALETAKAVTKEGGDAPTQAQIAAASASDAEWNKLLEEFPEWQSGIDKRIDYRVEARLSKLALPPAVDIAGLTGNMQEIVAKATSEAKAEARELAKIDRKYEGWDTEIVPTNEFVAWKDAQPPEIQALANSDRAVDAIRMLDIYTEHRKAVAEATAKAARNKQRLDSAITPKGTSTLPERTPSDEEAFARGFNKVRKKA